MRRPVNSEVMRYLLVKPSALVTRISKLVCLAMASLSLTLWPNGVFACSGPGAMSLINSNYRFALQLFAVGAALVVATVILYFFRKKRSSLIIAIVAALALAVHPAWTVSAMIGDCGMAKASSAVNATVLLGVLFTAQLALLLFTLLRKRRA